MIIGLPGVYIKDDAASRFWDKYILKTMSHNVPERARRWYVRHAELFIKAHSGRRLATFTADDMERYVNTPPAKAGGFELRLKAGSIGPSAD